MPGIGPKKASALIARYGSLDEVIAHADEVKGKMGENLRAHIDDALISRKIATIMTDAPIECDLTEVAFPAFDASSVSAALGELGIMAMQNRFLALLGEGAASAPVATSLEMPEVLRVALDASAAQKGDEEERAASEEMNACFDELCRASMRTSGWVSHGG